MGGGNVVLVGDEADPAVTVGEQLVDRGLGSADLVGYHRRQLGAVEAASRSTVGTCSRAARQVDPPVEHGRVEEAVHLVLQERMADSCSTAGSPSVRDQDQGAPCFSAASWAPTTMLPANGVVATSSPISPTPGPPVRTRGPSRLGT